VHGWPVQLLQHDARSIPLRDGSVDIVTCCLAAHHLDPPGVHALLTEMWRVARHAVLVSDLARGPLAYLGARLLALVLRNPLTAHDGPVSVLRAYTPAELRRLAVEAGLARVRVRTHPPARMTLIAEKGAEQ
jgi:ubiquinone/menaquinone biosynthesis C-methylase UbiE